MGTAPVKVRTAKNTKNKNKDQQNREN